jgi:hypothetical protein
MRRRVGAVDGLVEDTAVFQCYQRVTAEDEIAGQPCGNLQRLQFGQRIGEVTRRQVA